ncbi:MAG: NAD(+) synthase [Patescibacteria group bacterium]|nr:NAD(+) synthase [Patescibacteria group bacterium]
MKAIFVGRFQPFHLGHLEVIKWILKREKEIFIIIGSCQEFSKKENLFSFLERKEMIKRTLSSEGIKNFEIFGLPDLFNDLLWAKNILKITNLKKNEIIVFTRNSWTKRCFQKIGVKVELHPLFFNNLSATQIREKILKNERWENFVPSEVSNYLKEIEGQKRIKSLEILPEEKIVNFIRKKIKEAKAKGGIVGVSGGLDSSLVAFLTKKALGKRTLFLYLPFFKNSPFEKNISLLEKKLKTKIEKIYLGEIYQKILKILPRGDKLVRGNLMPRLRMVILYYFANLKKFLVIGTTNRSEREIGYTTKFGDSAADIFPIANFYKTDLIEMEKRLKLPKEIIGTVPTAELWSGQTDEKEIGLNYQNLDLILKLLSQGFREKEISLLTEIPKEKIKNIIKRRKENLHKFSFPQI